MRSYAKKTSQKRSRNPEAGESYRLLAAIDSAVDIRPEEASPILADLTDSDDGDIVEAAFEATAMAKEITRGENSDDDSIGELF